MFDELSDMLAQHEIFLGRRNKLGKMSSSQRLAQVNPQLIVLETGEEDISIKFKHHIVYKVVVVVKAEETISTEATVQAGEILKAEGTIKVENIIKEEDKVQVEEKF